MLKLFPGFATAALLVSLAGVSPGFADTVDDQARVDRLFEKWDKPSSPGCAMAVARGGQTVYARGYGSADLDHDVKITPTTVFHAASVSKQFTAAAALMLAQEGKLLLDSPARQYVPGLPDFGVPITLRHLLHHTSGLRDQWELLSLAGWRYSLDLITDADVLAVLARQKALNFAPGTKHLYSNTGFTLLAQAVKNVSGETFRDFTTKRIFQPLDMQRTFFRDNHAQVVKGIAYGYVQKGENFELSIPNFDTVGATSLLTTVEDLLRWEENFYTGRVGGAGLTKQMEERGRLNDGTELDYAAGLATGRYRGQRIVEHAGTDAGYKANLLRFPDQHFSVAILCNLAAINPTQLARRIADIYLGEVLGHAEPVRSPAVSPQPGADQLNEFVGVYVAPDADDRILRVRLQDGKLRGGLNIEGQSMALEAMGDGRFRYVENPTVELQFAGGNGGMPRTLVTFAQGKELNRYSLAPPYSPSVAQLRELTGVYRSEEVDMPYEVKLEGNFLLIGSLKSGRRRLLPVSADLLAGGGSRFRITRNEQGVVTGAFLNTDRIRQFRFERTPFAVPEQPR